MSQFLNICILPASIQNFGLVIYVEINLLDKSRVWKLLAKNFLQSETPMIDKRSEQPSPVLLENREWSRVETPAFLWLEDNGVCIFVAATSRASAFVLFTTGDTSLVSVNSRARNKPPWSLKFHNHGEGIFCTRANIYLHFHIWESINGMINVC